MNTGGEKQNQNAATGASPVSLDQGAGAAIDHGDGQFKLPLSTGSHPMRAEELDQDGKTLLPEPEVPVSEHILARADHDSLGERLRTARERMGLSRGDAAARLKLPLRLIARLEDDDYQGMEQGVYLRGYLRSYARLVGVPIKEAEDTAAAHTHAAPLVATGTVSRSRYLIDRYSVSATYLILTGLIVVPAVWLATHGGLEQNLARTTPLDSPTQIVVPPVAQTSLATTDQADADASNAPADTIAADTAATTPAAVEPPKPKQEQPIVASMTPFPSQSTTPAPAAEPVAASPAKTGAHALVLKLKGASWVEIVGADGSKLEYGLLSAGTERSYSSDGPLSVRLGNAEGAEVLLDGKSVDLTPFRRANVARLRAFDASGDGPHTDF